VIAFPGAAAATLAGLPVAVGYFAFCGLGALSLAGISGSNRSHSAESAAIGSLQALALALGFLFVGLYHGLLTGLDSLLFGTFLGITRDQVLVLLVVAAVAVLLVAIAARPLYFASVDADVARAGGVPVRLLGLGFLLVLGSRWPRRARSPARSWSSRCSSRRPRPHTRSPRGPCSESPSRSRSRSPSRGSGSHWPTTRSTRSAST
jgi:hypothetical protein